MALSAVERQAPSISGRSDLSTNEGYGFIAHKVPSYDFRPSNMEISEGEWACKTSELLLLFVNWL